MPCGMCGKKKNLRKEFCGNDLLPALSCNTFQLEDGSSGSGVIVAPLQGLLFLVTKGDSGT
jgi:hypothetical protein